MTTIDALRKRFLSKTEGSRQLYERARRVLPGGAARGATAFLPYPLYGRSAQGAVLTDVDGNDYLDFNLEGGSCILGHCAPQVVESVKEQLGRAEVSSISSELEVELGERLSRFFPFLQMMRFLNSGSEACAVAARLARAFTGKPLLAMFEGHHHGQLDTLLFSHYGAPVGPAEAPTTVCDSLGMHPGAADSVVILPFNETQAAVKLIEENADRLAAVFLEPLTIFGGAVPAEQEFIRAIRNVTQRLNILLVVDEVPAGVRIGPGGAIGGYGVDPDLYITGKALGGGLPVGVFGGRREIMEPFMTPPYDRSRKVLSSGTFSANPTVLASCLAVMDALGTGEVNRYINSLGEHVRERLRDLGQEMGVPLQVTGAHSIFGIHFCDHPVRNIRDAQTDVELRRDFAVAMMANGVLWPAARIAGFVSFAHTEEQIHLLVQAARQAMTALFAKAGTAS